tara:strand:- start:16208 stop:17485 length:1278 start_codon:yes stop_codon:yes gene_type:complete
MLGPIIIKQVVKLAKGTARFDAMANDMIAKFELGCPPKGELERIIQQKNTIVSALSQVSGVINTITKIGTTLDGILTGLNIAVNVIKFLPLPLPPFSPALLATGPAAAADTLGDLVKAGKGAVSIIPNALKQIADGINKLIAKLNTIDGLLNPCLAEAGLDGSINSDDLSNLLNTTGANSDSAVNQATEADLLAQLQPNSNDPLFYKGYKLEIQNDPQNEYSFASRRIKGKEGISGVEIYNQPTQSFSYSSSVQVLIDEIKFRIDLQPANPILLNAIASGNLTDEQIEDLGFDPSSTSGGTDTSSSGGFDTGQGPNRFLAASTVVPSFPNVSGKALVTTLPAKAKITINGGRGTVGGNKCYTTVTFVATLIGGGPNDKVSIVNKKVIQKTSITTVNFLKKGKYAYNLKITSLRGTDPNKASVEFI